MSALRALSAGPAWHDEPLHLWLAAQLGVGPRAAREVLERIDVRAALAPSTLGLLDETWLYRTDAAAAPREGVVGWIALEGGYALVRTLARDAVDRERKLTALRAALGERPVLQLERPVPPPPKRKLARADWALARELVATPWAPLATKPLRERAAKLVADGVLALDARPRGDAFHVAVRLKPSSSAAATRALDAIPSLYRRHVPTTGEAAFADGCALADDVAAAREVPGVASVEARRVVARWEDGAALDALLKDAERRAA